MSAPPKLLQTFSNIGKCTKCRVGWVMDDEGGQRPFVAPCDPHMKVFVKLSPKDRRAMLELLRLEAT